MTQTEDIDYQVSDHATPEPEDAVDEDQQYKGVITEVDKYLDEAIAEHNSLDTIDLTEAAKLTTSQQIAVNKLVVNHLRAIKDMVNSKLKELK